MFLQAEIDAAVKELLDLKQKYKSVSGVDYAPSQSVTASKSSSAKAPAAEQQAKKTDQAEKKSKKQVYYNI